MKGHKNNKYKPVLSKQTRMHGLRSTWQAHKAVDNIEEHLPGEIQHLAFVANPHVCEAPASIHPVSHSLWLALVQESFLPDITKCYLRSQA